MICCSIWLEIIGIVKINNVLINNDINLFGDGYRVFDILLSIIFNIFWEWSCLKLFDVKWIFLVVIGKLNNW